MGKSPSQTMEKSTGMSPISLPSYQYCKRQFSLKKKSIGSASVFILNYMCLYSLESDSRCSKAVKSIWGEHRAEDDDSSSIKNVITTGFIFNIYITVCQTPFTFTVLVENVLHQHTLDAKSQKCLCQVTILGPHTNTVSTSVCHLQTMLNMSLR